MLEHPQKLAPMTTNTPNPHKSHPIADLYEQPDRCQKPSPQHPDVFAPFADSDRSHDKTRIIRFLCYHPDGVPVSRLVKALLPDSNEQMISDRSYSNTDYRFVSRFLQRTKYAELDSQTSVKTAYPQPAAFHLTQESKIPTRGSRDYAKDRAELCIDRIWSLNDVKNAQMLAKDFAVKLDSIDDRRLMLQEKSDQDKKITMPYHTRFNNEHRKSEQWARYNFAWEQADERYDRGVMITLTTDPKRYESIQAMVDGLMSSWQDLHETLNQRYLNDQRLDFIRALEFGGSDKSDHIGLPHLHVCVFGVPYVDHSWLKNYWTDRHGEIVHIHGMNKRGDHSWTMQTGQHKGKSAAGYLGKYLSKTFEDIGDDPDELFAELESWEEGGSWPNSNLWKLALYWATGRQFWSCSHDLKEDPDPETLQEIDGLGETKLDRLAKNGIQTLSDVRLSDEEEIAQIDGISENFAKKLTDIAGEPSEFDICSFEFVGASTYAEMPITWSADARHIGLSSTG